MPIYEYDCPDCGAMFEHLAKRFDEPAPICPGCGSARSRRRISAVRVVKSKAEWQERQERAASGSLQEQAQFLQQAGELAEQVTQNLDASAYQELLRERARGASDADLKELGDALVPPGAADVRIEHEHHHSGDEQNQAKSAAKPVRRKHLGWA